MRQAKGDTMNTLNDLRKEYGFPFVAGTTRQDNVIFYAQDNEGQFIGEANDKKIRQYPGDSKIWTVYRQKTGLVVKTNDNNWKNDVNQFLVTHSKKTFKIELSEI